MQLKVFNGNVFRYEMGLQSLDLQTWIDIDSEWAHYLALKKQLLETQTDKVFQVQPEAFAPSQQLLILVAEHVAQYYPQQFTLSGRQLREKSSGITHDLNSSASHPLKTLAALVQEDFCLMKNEGKESTLVGGCVCFPSRWRLSEKVGQNMGGIHQPVPGFKNHLASPATRFLLNTTESKPMWRVNWSLHDSDRLFAYDPVQVHKSYGAAEVLDRTFLRVERQTFRKLESLPYVVFSIRTYLWPMTKVARDQEMRSALRGQLNSMSEEIAAYKGLTNLRAPLVDALS